MRLASLKRLWRSEAFGLALAWAVLTVFAYAVIKLYL
jgi:hypothetical protein